MTCRPLIWVDGIIGAGKTTLVRRLSEKLGMLALYEPVDDNPYLKDFYEDPKRWAFPMQVHMLHCRYQLHVLAMREIVGGAKGVLLDRGLPGDKIFCDRQAIYGNMSDRERSTYNALYDSLTRHLPPPSTMVYLDVSPKVAHARAVLRSREAEKHLTLKYLEDLEADYAVLVDRLSRGEHPWSYSVDVLRVPWDAEDLPVEPIARSLVELNNLEIEHGPVRPQGVVRQPQYLSQGS